jgi:polyhydroxyalkanoate synthesis regulator phasin
MKQAVFCVLATGLILSAGCSKKEEPAPNPPAIPKATLPEQAQAVSKDLTQKAEAVTAQATEKVTAVVEQAKVAAQELSQKAQTAIKELTVNKDDVMAELNQPVTDIKAKVAALGQPELMAYASTYKDLLLEKKDQLAGLTNQLKALPMGDMLGAKGKAIKDQLSQYTSQLSGLKERYGVYLDKLKALGVDLSAFGI